MTRAKAIADNCRECIHDRMAAGTWREQVALCGCTDCPLWVYRPLPTNAPPWIASRDPGTLPPGFVGMDHDDAIASLRGNVAANANGCAVQAIRGGCGEGVATHVAATGVES